MNRILCDGKKRLRHPKLRWLGKKALHLLITFVLGVAIATIYHEIVSSNNVRSAAERVCVLYGKNESECKSNIDNVLEMSDDEVQNNININGGGK